MLSESMGRGIRMTLCNEDPKLAAQRVDLADRGLGYFCVATEASSTMKSQLDLALWLV